MTEQTDRITPRAKTFGDFFNAVQQDGTQGQIWMDDWIVLVDDARWQEVQRTPLSDEWVMCFAEDMLTMFRERMQSICTDALYSRVNREGREFMQHIIKVAAEFGVAVQVVCGGPATPTEALMQAADRQAAAEQIQDWEDE